jgi:outer membrane lipoprotein carrier protein
LRRPAVACLTILVWLLASASSAAEIDLAAVAVSGSEAQFTHSFTPKGFKSPQIESGSVIFGKLPAMRWTYAKPEQKTFVFDGTRSWFYVPADKQVTVADIDDQRKRDLPFLLVGDQAARERHFAVREERRGGQIMTTLQPRDAASLVRTVTVTSNASSHLIESIDYTDRDGNRTLFTFSGYHPARVSADTFNFAVPAGVQVVRGD